MDTEKITVITRINAEPQKIWRLWTQPEHITKWNFANDDWLCPKADIDLRNGSVGFDFEGIYDEIIDHEKITYTLSDGRVSTTTFENLGEHTELTITFDAEQQTSIEIQREGWQSIINNFKRYVESR